MQRKTILLFLALILVLSPLAAQQRSVVLINTEAGSGYGVSWGGPGKIVTALHVVTGRSKIFVKWEGKESEAFIEKVYKPADLALLNLKTPLGIPQMEIYPGEAPTDTDLNYWEAALKTFRISGKTTQLEKTAVLGNLTPRLSKDRAAQIAFAKALCTDGKGSFPALTTTVFKFEEPNIDKAHSGSPLTFENKIVGLVDGGDKPVNGKTAVWAIPASEFQNLIRSGVPVTGAQTPCSSANLYSGLRSDNPHLDPKLAELAKAISYSEQNPLRFKDDNGKGLVFSLNYRATCKDIYETMFEEDQGYIYDLVQENEDFYEEGDRATVYDLFPKRIDLYQEEETGATIAIPANSKLTVEQLDGHTIIKASSPYKGISMIIYVKRSNSIEESKEAMSWFKDYLVSDREDWVEETDEEEEIEDYLDDEEEPYYNELMERVAYDDEESLIAEFYASLTIDDTDFLGVVVKVDDWAALDENKEERLFFYMLEACSILTDFSYH